MWEKKKKKKSDAYALISEPNNELRCYHDLFGLFTL